METQSPIISLEEIDDGEVYESYLNQKHTLPKKFSLAHLRRVSQSPAIESDHSERSRYIRALNKLEDSRPKGDKLPIHKLHALLQNPNLWVRSDIEKATSEDWEYIEQVDRKKRGLLSPTSKNDERYNRPDNFFVSWAAPTWLGGIKNVLHNSTIDMN